MAKASAETLAELLFYDEKGSGVNFDKLSDDERAAYKIRALKIFEMLDKMELMTVGKVSSEKLMEARLKNLDQLTEIIKGFVKGLKTTKPELFPAGELACWIMEGRTK